jgi:hypothetical protein
MPDSTQFQMPSVPRFNTTSLPAEVVETTVQNPRQQPTQVHPEAPKAKGKAQHPRQERAIPVKFEIVHSKILDGKLAAFCFGLVMAQGVLAKVQAETGLPTWEIYWVSVAVVILVGLVSSSKMGSTKGFILMLQLAVAAAVSPAFALLFRSVFGA